MATAARATSLLRTGAKIGLGSVTAVTAASSGVTLYAYQTDESWRRCIDFHVLMTPMCWDYYKCYTFPATTPSGDDDTKKKQQELQKLHEMYAPIALQHILSLGGYYVKCAQMMCGMSLLPEAYEKEFSILLDQVPPKPFDVIQQIILKELGGASLDEHFQSFDKTPMAAASIGQVHAARLADANSTSVVVKVQYPEVERFFHLDVLSMKNLCLLCVMSGIEIGIDKQSLDKLFDEFTKSFKEEFDYRLEAENMTLIATNVAKIPEFASQIKVPLPVLEKTTRKVLTMTRIQGEPIQKRMQRMMDEWAAKAGKSRHELQQELQQKFQDPVELQKLLAQKPPSSFQILMYRLMLRTSDVISNSSLWLGSWFSKHKQPPPTYKWSTLPLDASRITSLLFRVHAHQLFFDGAVSADPHAGNILICDDGTVGLVDFGNVQRIPDKNRRVALAKFYLAMAKDWSDQPSTWNDAEIVKAFVAVGGASTRNDTTFLAVNALLAYDMRYDPATLQRFGINPDLSNLVDVYTSCNGDTFQEFPADLVNLQRLSQTLVGVASIIGAGQPSCARMWQSQCEQLVADAESTSS